jgi:hypothetical protein
VIAVFAVLLATTLGCGGTGEPTPDQRREADARWDTQFEAQVGHRSDRTFSLKAEWLDEGVLVTVRAHHDGVTFSDLSLGVALFGYRDGEWREVGDAGPSLPATRILGSGDTVRIRLSVTEEATLYRAAVRVVDDGRLSLSWVALSRK